MSDAQHKELKNLLEALEQKLGNLALYENQLIKEAETLKNMYWNLITSITKTNETYDKFYNYTKDILDHVINERFEKALKDLRKEIKFGFLYKLFNKRK
jgi:hypothetical protein